MKAEIEINNLISWYLKTNKILSNLNSGPDVISFEKFIILQKLSEKKVVTITEIAKQMKTTTPAASHKVTQLAKLGLVKKEHGMPDDQRIVLLHLTTKGKNKYKELTDYYYDRASKIDYKEMFN